MRVLYFGVKSAEYPRNRTIRRFLERDNHVEIVPIDPSDGFVRNAIQLLGAERRHRGYDVVILSEFSHQFALIAWLAAKRMRAVLVVDFFVGLFETRVLDANKSRLSLKALTYWLCDKVALDLSDVALIDTHVRAREAKRRFLVSALPVVVPVGAPPWAVSQPKRNREPGDALRVLYYGNYLPLHGLETVIEECSLAKTDAKICLTLVGEGGERPLVEALVDRQEARGWCRFLPPVAESKLADMIYSHDVVLGTFGSSTKADGIIANKTWQGIACGRIVVTKDVPALAELSAMAGPLLIGAKDEPGRRLRDVLVDLAGKEQLFDPPELQHLALRRYVDDHLVRMMAVVARKAASRGRR